MRQTISLSDKDFTAGVVIDESDHVVQAAPKVRYMLGWNSDKVLKYAQRRGWKSEFADKPPVAARKIEIRGD